MLRDLFEILYPPRCIICEEDLRLSSVGRSSHLPSHLCQECDQFTDSAILAPENLLSAANHCARCGEPASSAKSESCMCTICQLWPPPSRNMRSLITYSPSVKQALKKLKYEGQLPLAKYFGAALANAVLEHGIFPIQDWDVIIPLPSAGQQTRLRGFNHTAHIAKHFGKIINCYVDPYALRSVGPRLSQVNLCDDVRSKNVTNAFRGIPQRVSGLSILLFDDVITTGSSAWSATISLLDAGADSVDVLSIARSRSFRRRRLTSSSVELELPNDEAVELG